MRDRPTLTHIALHVREVEACIAFYRDVCGLVVARERPHPKGGRIVWLAEPGRERAFVLVLLPGGAGRNQSAQDFSHLGFALSSKAAVDAIAERGRAAGVLVWPPRQDAYPAGYYCGLRDPDGTMVEFSYGQPLGPGAAEGEGREG
ncbi:MAG: VOC family protein [Alphaproteobacteria bacterium]|nr:VOC family protein [Alphaproteobacteria bacterium]